MVQANVFREWVNSVQCCCYFAWSCANHAGSHFQTYRIPQCSPEFLHVCRFPLLVHVPNIQAARNTWDFCQKTWLHRVKIPLHFLSLLSLDPSSSAIKSFSMPHIAQGCCEVRYLRNTEVQRYQSDQNHIKQNAVQTRKGAWCTLLQLWALKTRMNCLYYTTFLKWVDFPGM